MDKLIKLLHEGNYSCVIKNKEISTFTQRGITDLYDLLNTDPAFLRGPLRASCFLLQNENRAAENTACYLPFANTFCPLADRTLKEPP